MKEFTVTVKSVEETVKKATIVGIRKLARDVSEVTLAFEEGVDVGPGQYILLCIGDVWRPFTAVVDPASNCLVRLVIQLIDSTVTKRFFDSVHIGDVVKIQGPKGHMVESVNCDSVFVATGTGIVPLVEIAKHMLGSGSGHKVRIIFGIREQAGLFYDEELQSLEDVYDSCQSVVAMSTAHDSWTGYRGRVNDYIEEYFSEMRDADFYICGKKETVASITRLLDTLGVSRERRRYIE